MQLEVGILPYYWVKSFQLPELVGTEPESQGM